MFKIDLKETEHKKMDWIQLARDGIQWQVLLNRVMNLGVPIKGGEYWWHLSGYQHLKKDPAS